jgi:hypothetical protein
MSLDPKVLDRARSLDNGKFSNYRPSTTGGEELSHADRIALYEKAYALHHTNPSESKAEIARLDRMFAK